MDKHTTTIEEPPVSPDNAPGVIAYRMGQVETAVKEGFREHRQLLESMANTFATKEEMATAQVEADKEHVRLWAALNNIKKSFQWWVGTIIAAVAAAAAAVYTIGQLGK